MSCALRRHRDRLQEYQGVLLRQKREFSPKYGASLIYEHHTTSLVFKDSPAHTAWRRLIMGALSPRAIRREWKAT